MDLEIGVPVCCVCGKIMKRHSETEKTVLYICDWHSQTRVMKKAIREAVLKNKAVFDNAPLKDIKKKQEEQADEKTTNLQGREGGNILGTPRRYRKSPDLSEF